MKQHITSHNAIKVFKIKRGVSKRTASLFISMFFINLIISIQAQNHFLFVSCIFFLQEQYQKLQLQHILPMQQMSICNILHYLSLQPGLKVLSIIIRKIAEPAAIPLPITIFSGTFVSPFGSSSLSNAIPVVIVPVHIP